MQNLPKKEKKKRKRGGREGKESGRDGKRKEGRIRKKREKHTKPQSKLLYESGIINLLNGMHSILNVYYVYITTKKLSFQKFKCNLKSEKQINIMQHGMSFFFPVSIKFHTFSVRVPLASWKNKLTWISSLLQHGEIVDNIQWWWRFRH